LATGTFVSEEEKNKINIVEKKGIKIAFLSYTTLTNGIKRKKKYELNVFDEKIVKKELEDAKKKI
jgi:poly-gamma-glutamate synthesis protein (capsule biosynthesis protein)